ACCPASIASVVPTDGSRAPSRGAATHYGRGWPERQWSLLRTRGLADGAREGHARREPQLSQRPRPELAGGALADAELEGDLLVGGAARELGQDLPLPRG